MHLNKYLIISVLNILLLEVCSADVRLDTNIIKNGNFEEKFDGWHADDSAHWIQDKGVDGSGVLFMNASYFVNPP